MEIVFLNNLLKATEELGEDEVLLCPVGLWTDYIEKGVGGIIEKGNKVRPFHGEEIRSVREQLFCYGRIKPKQNFFYVLKPGLILRELERIFEDVRKNEEYLRKEIVEDLGHLKEILGYDLFIIVPDLLEGQGISCEAEVVKSVIEKEVDPHLIGKEGEKKKLYRDLLETLEYTLNFLKRVGEESIKKALSGNLELYIQLPEKVRKLGTEKYIKSSSIYKEAKNRENRSLILLPLFLPSGKPLEDYMEIVNGVGTKSLFNLSIDEVKFNKVYLVFGEYKIYVDSEESYCLIGFPFFKVRISSAFSEFRSRNVVVRRGESNKTDKGVTIARLKVEDFTIKSLYEKEPKVLKTGPGERSVEVYEKFSIKISLRRRKEETTIGRETYYVGAPDCKISEIEIKHDGSFSTNIDYSNICFVEINDTRGEEKYYPGWRTSELMEKLSSGKRVKGAGEITRELSQDNRKLYVLRESSFYQGDDVVENYLELSFRGILKALLPKIRGKIDRNHYTRLELWGEGGKYLLEKIQTGFLQMRIGEAIKYMEKVERKLCFSPVDGERYFINHPIAEKEVKPEEIVKELDFYKKAVDLEGLRGEKKKIESVLKLISYSYPLLSSLMIEELLSELRDRVSSFLKSKEAPIEEIEVSIKGLVPRASPYDPGTFALFLSEGEEVKFYKNRSKPSHILKDFRVIIGNLEIEAEGI